MCTAVTYRTGDFYFGRNLDLDRSYGEEVVVMPRHFPVSLRHGDRLERHHAIIGMAHVADGQPLYYDGMNEKGLCAAGLNFVGNAHYGKPVPDRENITHFEVIPWILARCATVDEAAEKLEHANIVDTPFGGDLPVSQLHWMISDFARSIVLESTREGLKLWDNPVGVLTNNPPFDRQLFGLTRYMGLSAGDPENRFAPWLPLEPYSLGMGALGLPGDLSSESRFVRAAFVKHNSVSGVSEEESVSQFFHILGSVEQTNGCCRVGDGYERTVYSSCCNAGKGIYYYTTYGNRQITGVNLFREALDGTKIARYPLELRQQIRWAN